MDPPVNGPVDPRLPPVRLEEYRPVACSSCGSQYRRSRGLMKHLVHRFDDRRVLDVLIEFFFCARCGRQVDGAGQVVGPDHPGRAPAEFYLTGGWDENK